MNQIRVPVAVLTDKEANLAYIRGEMEQALIAGNEDLVRFWEGQVEDLDEDLALLENQLPIPKPCRTCNPTHRCGDCHQPITKKGYAPDGTINFYPHPDVTPPPPLPIHIHRKAVEEVADE